MGLVSFQLSVGTDQLSVLLADYMMSSAFEGMIVEMAAPVDAVELMDLRDRAKAYLYYFGLIVFHLAFAAMAVFAEIVLFSLAALRSLVNVPYSEAL